MSIVKYLNLSPLHVQQSVMTECQCIHVVVQDPSLVVPTSHECLGLFLRADIESLVVDALEVAFDHCIFLLLCVKSTLVQFDVLHDHSLTIDHDIARNSLCCIVYDMLLVNQAVHLRSQSNELHDAMSGVLVLEDGSRQLLVEVEEQVQWRELALVHFLFVVVYELSIEVARVIQFREVEQLVHRTHPRSSTRGPIRCSIAWYFLPYCGTGTSIGRSIISWECKYPSRCGVVNLGVVNDHGDEQIAKDGSMECEQESDGYDVGILEVCWIDPFKRAVTWWTLDEHGVVHGTFFTTVYKERIQNSCLHRYHCK